MQLDKWAIYDYDDGNGLIWDPQQQISGELDRRRATIMRLALSTRKG